MLTSYYAAHYINGSSGGGKEEFNVFNKMVV
jgi:hypothetical protein